MTSGSQVVDRLREQHTADVSRYPAEPTPADADDEELRALLEAEMEPLPAEVVVTKEKGREIYTLSWRIDANRQFVRLGDENGNPITARSIHISAHDINWRAGPGQSTFTQYCPSDADSGRGWAYRFCKQYQIVPILQMQLRGCSNPGTRTSNYTAQLYVGVNDRLGAFGNNEGSYVFNLHSLG